MTWEVHEGGKQIDASGQQLRVGSWLPQTNTCEMCSHYSSQLMQCAADAVKQATLKPDDQIWFMVFSALQEMLMHRTSCLASHAAQVSSTPSREQLLTRPQAPAAGMVPQKTNLKTHVSTQKNTSENRSGVAIAKNNVATAPSTPFWRGTAFSWFGLRASPHPGSIGNHPAVQAGKRVLPPGAGLR